ncbi:MAG: insulinase family protein [Muribaculaceae bacterium]|nr:insulinase family protein [Muribaculaceae bacterium]
MKKRLLGAAMLLLGATGAFAQQPQMQELPLNPAVKHGTLPNGLQYFILHNEEPKERANFYIAQKVGSTLENSDQLGLAHFLEHMAFNGTTNYPGKSMLNYLQNKGLRFGYDINAYTGFDETVYRINNVPTTDAALVDSVLLVIHDWSSEILLEDSEIEAERGVIEEEWRSTSSDANSRFGEYVLPKVYSEYNYQQAPIGKMEVVRNFKPETLRAYYKKWYRPDLQGIIVVGDINADEMEKKVIDLFSKVPMPENAAERVYPSVSDNKEPIYVYYEDPEMQYPNVSVSFKSDPLPVEMRNSIPGFAQKVFEAVIPMLINNRLNEYAQKPECKYAFARTSMGHFMVSKTKDAFDIEVFGKADLKEAFNDAMAIVARACKTGFTDSELERVRDQIIAMYEKKYNERDKTNSHAIAQGIIRHFIDNTPEAGAEMEYELVKQLLPSIPVQAINQMVSQILTPDNQVVIVSQPKKDGYTVIAKEEILPILENSIAAEYEAYVDEVITDPLLLKAPKAGKIKSTTPGAFDTTEIMLSNGVKVIVKSTDFKADEISMVAFKNGGLRSYPESQAANILMISDAYDCSKLGAFNPTTLRKYLAGKNLALSYSVTTTANMFNGSTTVKDLPTFMELLYASFTEVSPDFESYQATKEQNLTFLKNKDKDPDSIFEEHLYAAEYNNNPMFQSITTKVVEAADYQQMVNIFKESTANAADYTFVFVGNIDLNTFKPLLEQYVASLPAKKANNKVNDLTPIKVASGQITDIYDQPMHTPKSNVAAIFSGDNVPYSIENSVKVTTIGQILMQIYLDTLREEMGGTYTPQAYSYLDPNTGQWMVFYNYQTNADLLDKMEERANLEFQKLLSEGASEKHFNQVKEAAAKQYDIAIRLNGYWLNNLVSYQRGFDNITNHKAAIEGLTLEGLNSFMKNLYNGKNHIQVIMKGVEEK